MFQGYIPQALDTGDPDAKTSELTAAVANVVKTTNSYSDPTWITALAATKLTGTIDIARMPTSVARLDIGNTFVGNQAVTGNLTASGNATIGDGIAGNRDLYINASLNPRLILQAAGTNKWGFIANYPTGGSMSIYDYDNAVDRLIASGSGVAVTGNITASGTVTPGTNLIMSGGFVDFPANTEKILPSTYSGVYFEVRSNNGLASRNSAGSGFSPFWCSNITASGTGTFGSGTTPSTITVLTANGGPIRIKNGGNSGSSVQQIVFEYAPAGNYTNSIRSHHGTGATAYVDLFLASGEFTETRVARFRGDGLLDVTGNITASGSITSVFQSLSADPTTLDLTAGQSRLVKNTTSGLLKLCANDGGTLKSVTLT